MIKKLDSVNKIWLGAAVLVLIAVLVAVLVGVKRAALGYTTYHAEFLQAAQLGAGNQVMIAGISVGTVTGTRLAGDHVVAEFTVRDNLRLPDQTRAAIKLTALLGSRYLELTPFGAGKMQPRTIPLARTTVPYDLQTTLTNATTTFEAVDANKISQSLQTLTQGLTGIPEALPQALGNITSLAQIIAARRDQLGALLRSVDTVTATIRDQKANLGSLVLQGRTLLGDVVTRRAAVQRLLASTTALIQTLSQLLKAEPGFDKTLTALRNFTQMIASHDALLRNTLQALPIPLRNFANATGSATAIDLNVPAGILIDSWMCAISGRAQQFGMIEYFKDCQ
ncbi:MCE-family protein Mce6C [Mycobacteroides abscessus subsp. abscessus]|uniref:MCE family protein n=1 Tax=Mycobacteroides abscessus TaxID=36809 RepID=UPI0009286CEB|nr:MCE family protein [Mycobacteroides abscessus]MBN7437889.1 MCE family protein [Mycobacteroides abscessus subsp. abscessus]MDM1888404.1 MCE family protein [Mycobacteroides abscessus]MDM1893174.1 MCE family protein [Mycobacteroides abscessus]MDO3110974.1 MCE family protein [Mycobacteroides abscessus subsp. abscessus]RIS00109.1 MCE family protein [Mycobacteroides abscessus]